MRLEAVAVGLLAAAIAMQPAGLAAQNVHTSLLYEQILENIKLTKTGHVLDSFGIVRLNPGTATRIAVDVPPSRSIEIMGDCDKGCFDLDIVVYDSGGEAIAEDLEPDYYPIVEFTSYKDGRIEIEMIMADCEDSYCYAAYSVFIQD